MTEKKTFFLRDANVKRNALGYVANLPTDEVTPLKLTIQPMTRSLDQNAKFHALVDDIASSGAKWMGQERTAAQWKVLFVSGHAVATGKGAEVVPGLEGEFVNIRESTASMSKERGSSLIEYTLAWCAQNGVEVSA